MPKELRVHGVSGTPPGDLLYTAPVTYDQGWDLAKVYQPVKDDWDVRVFHWGSLTSKSSLTAFWILLAPFAMANVAGWMSERPNVWSRIWIRVAGLALTGIFFAQIANMGFDIPFSAGMSPTTVRWMYTVVCVALVLGIGLLSTQSSFKPLTPLERLRHLFAPTLHSMNPPMKDPEWDDPADLVGGVVGTRMWSVHSIVHRLRRLHLTFGMAVLSIVVARATSNEALGSAALIIAGVTMVVLGISTDALAANRVVLAVTAVAPLFGLAVLVWALLTLAPAEIAFTSLNVSDDLTYEIALLLGIAAGLGLVGEMIAGGFRRGWVPLGLLSVATLIGATLGLTGAMLVETYLTEASTTAETFDAGATFVTVGMLGLALVLGLVFVVATFIPREGAEGSRLRRGILRARGILTFAGVYGAAIGVVAAIWSCNGEFGGCTQANLQMPAWVIEDPDNLSILFGLPFDPASLLGWAKILMVAIPAILIVRSVVGGLLNGQDSRRKVGILWDLGSFWPRWFQPLAPPAYGPYAVTRMQTVISEEKPDVLAAHSQGSLIAAVALCLADEDTAPQMLITYGSQLGDLYPSLFPAVGLEALVDATISQVEGRWLNLWRCSDAIGGQVIPKLGTRNWEVITGSGHSYYELAPEFCAARNAVLSGDLLRPSDSVMATCWDG